MKDDPANKLVSRSSWPALEQEADSVDSVLTVMCGIRAAQLFRDS